MFRKTILPVFLCLFSLLLVASAPQNDEIRHQPHHY